MFPDYLSVSCGYSQTEISILTNFTSGILFITKKHANNDIFNSVNAFSESVSNINNRKCKVFRIF